MLTPTGFGTGQTNTNIILGCSPAASVCDNLVLNGFSDWYFPSLDEMATAINVLRPIGIGNIANSNYNTSSELNNWQNYVVGAYVNYGWSDFGKIRSFLVRAIRNF